MTSRGQEDLARAAYEAHRGAQSRPLPPWEDITEHDRQAWRATVSAVASEAHATRPTASEPVAVRSLIIQIGDQRREFRSEFTAGRHGTLVISNEFASGHHARFSTSRGGWYVEDLGSRNGTWLNGHRIYTGQWLKRGDKIGIGHALITVLSV